MILTVPDALTGPPSTSAWSAPAVLVGLIGVSVTIGLRRPRDPETARAARRVTERTRWLGYVGSVLALAPVAVALFGGGTWPTVLWWFVLGFCGLSVVFLTFGSAIALIRRWPSLRREIQPHERRASFWVVALMLAAPAAIPVSLALLIDRGTQTTVALALSFALGYGIWHIAYAITRRAPSLA